MAKKPQLAIDTRPWRDPKAKPFVRIKNVTKKFGDVAAVSDVSLDIYKSELFCLLGGSGSGKSTLLRMLAGFEVPTSGTIEIDGQDMTDVAPYNRPVNMMFQSYALFPHMTVEQNIAYGLKRDHLPRAEIQDRVAELLSLVKLQDYGKRKPHQLSGGQRQRVALARALAKRPKLLLLDEPLSNLDARLRDTMRHELSRMIARAGVTALFVTHDQAEAFALADQVAVMERGKIVQEGPPREIYRRPQASFVATFLGAANLLKGRVTGEGGTPGHRLVTLDTRSGNQCLQLVLDHAPGRDVELVIRPEDIRLSDRPAAAPGLALEGRVDYVSFLGAMVEYGIDIDGTQVKVMTYGTSEVAQGQPVWLQIEGGRCAVFAD